MDRFGIGLFIFVVAGDEGVAAAKGTKRFAEVSNDITSLAAAFIGTEGAIEFAEFCRNYNRQVTPEDIIISNVSMDD